MGLLDGLMGDSFDDPRTQAMLALSAGLLSNNGSKGLSAGLLGAGQAYQGARDAESARALKKAQAEELMSKIQEERAKREALQSLPAPQLLAAQTALSGGGGPTIQNGQRMPAISPQMDAMHRLAQAGALPASAYLGAFSPKELPINKIDPKDFTPQSVAKYAQTGNYGDLERLDKLHFQNTGGTVVGLNQFTGQQVGPKLPMTGNPFSDLVTLGPDNQLAPNQPLINAKSMVAAAGAPRTDVKVENKMGEGIAAQVGPMVKSGFDAAQGALGQADAADRIAKAVASNKLFTGPTANVQMFGARLGQAIGIGGKDDAEKIANTQQVIRGLAEFSLNARKALAGQGSVTENEQKLLDRAVSGDITLTGREIQQIADITRRQAQKTYQLHQANVTRLRSNPNTAGLADFYTLPDMPAAGGGDWSVQKVQ